jgi:hypothetical protein
VRFVTCLLLVLRCLRVRAPDALTRARRFEASSDSQA